MEFIQEELKEIKELLKKQTLLQKEILTIEEASYFLGLSVHRLYKMTSNKEIPFYKPGGKKIYLNRIELQDWIISSRESSVDDLNNELDSYINRNHKI